MIKRLLIRQAAACTLFLLSLSFSQDSNREKISLEECLGLALENNPRVHVSELALQAKGHLWLASQGVWDPALRLQTQKSRTEQPQPTSVVGDVIDSTSYSADVTKKLPTGTEAAVGIVTERLSSNSSFQTLNPSYASQWGLNLKQPLLQNSGGLLDRGEVSLRRADWELARFSHQQEVEAVLSEVETAYWNWVYAQEILFLRQKLLSLSQEFLEAEQGRANLLVQPPASLLQIQADLAQREADLEQAQEALQEAQDSLKQLILPESPLQDFRRLAPSEALESTYSREALEESLQKAFQYRKDYLAQRRQLDRDAVEVRMSKNKKWPSLDMTASLTANGLGSTASQDFQSLRQDDFYSWGVGLSLNVPFGNRKGRGNALEVSSRARSGLLKIKKLETEITHQITTAHQKIQSLEKRQTLAKKRLELEKKRLGQAEKDYRNGRIDIRDLLDVQADTAEASLAYWGVLLEWRLALLDESRSQGILYETRALKHKGKQP